jgi:hypothetical protein
MSSGDSVPEIVLRGRDILERARQLGQEVERRTQEAIAQPGSQPAPSAGNS